MARIILLFLALALSSILYVNAEPEADEFELQNSEERRENDIEVKETDFENEISQQVHRDKRSNDYRHHDRSNKYKSRGSKHGSYKRTRNYNNKGVRQNFRKSFGKYPHKSAGRSYRKNGKPKPKFIVPLLNAIGAAGPIIDIFGKLIGGGKEDPPPTQPPYRPYAPYPPYPPYPAPQSKRKHHK